MSIFEEIRVRSGENIEAITHKFPFWFCDEFKKYANNEFDMSFDHPYLMSLVAPRKVCVGTAENDLWADTDYQLLTCMEADDVYKMIYDEKGYISKYSLIAPENYYTKRSISFYNRTGEMFYEYSLLENI